MIPLPRLSLAFVFATVPLAAQVPSAAGGSPARLTRQTEADSAVAIENVSVIPMDRERVLDWQTVLVTRGVIARLGPTRAVTVPSGTRTIDGTGKFLLPGFADVHVHLASNPEDEQRTLLKLFLANGVTTVLNMRGIPQILELRRAVAAGRILGPRIYTVGPYVNEPFVTTPEEVERAVVEQKRAGYDFIKLHGSLSREAYATLNRVARREAIRVIGHAPRNLGVEVMFEERQYALAHAEEFLYDRQNRSTDSSLPAVEAKIPEYARATARAQIWVMPNLTAVQDDRAYGSRPAGSIGSAGGALPAKHGAGGMGSGNESVHQPHRPAPLRADDGALPAARENGARVSRERCAITRGHGRNEHRCRTRLLDSR